MTTKLGIIKKITYNVKPEHHIPYQHIDIIVNMFIDEIKESMRRQEKVVLHGLAKFDTKIADEKVVFF